MYQVNLISATHNIRLLFCLLLIPPTPRPRTGPGAGATGTGRGLGLGIGLALGLDGVEIEYSVGHINKVRERFLPRGPCLGSARSTSHLVYLSSIV